MRAVNESFYAQTVLIVPNGSPVDPGTPVDPGATVIVLTALDRDRNVARSLLTLAPVRSRTTTPLPSRITRGFF